MHLSRCALYFAALIIIAPVAHSAVTVEAVRVGSAYSGPSNQKLFDATIKTTSSTPGVPAKYVSRTLAVSPASVGRLARAATGGPLGVALAAGMLAHGLLIDNDTGEIVNPGETYSPDDYPYTWNCVYGSGVFWGVTPESVLSSCVSAVESSTNLEHCNADNPFSIIRYEERSASQWRVYYVGCSGSTGTRTAYRSPNQGQADFPPSPASEFQVEDAVSDELLRDLINDLIQRRPSQIPTILPELASEMDATRDAQEAAESHSSDPGANPAPTPEQQEIVDNQTTTAPTMASEWPTFCSWATIVCDFIDWMRAEPELPEHPPIPLLDIDIDDYDSALPATASCPAPVTVTTGMWGSFELSYQPFCDLAAYIRLALLGIAYLYAAYIVIGVRR